MEGDSRGVLCCSCPAYAEPPAHYPGHDVYVIECGIDRNSRSKKLYYLVSSAKDFRTHPHVEQKRSLGSDLTAFCSRRSRTFSLNADAATGGRFATRRFILYRCQSVEK